MRLLLLVAAVVLAVSLLPLTEGLLATAAPGGAEARSTREGPGGRSVVGAMLEQERAAGAPARTPALPDGWRAPFSGRLVDVLTGEPLPHLAIELGGEKEPLRTDGEGRVRGTVPRPAGALTASLDFGSMHWSARVEHGPLAAEDRPVPAGPTYRLVTSADLAGREAFLYSPLDPALPRLRAEVRADPGGLWLRFAPPPRELFGKGPWGLVCSDGAHTHEGRVHRLVGAGHPPVPLRAIRRSGLEVSVGDEHGHVPIGADVRLTPLEGPNRDRQRVEKADLTGTARFDVLRPGPYEVTVSCSGYYDQRQVVELEPGDGLALEVTLDAVVAQGRIDVVVESATGTFRGEGEVWITPVTLDEPGQTWNARAARIEWAREGAAWIGRCAFEGLPGGEYEVAPVGRGFLCWAPGRAQARPGAGPVPLRLLDRGDEADLVLRVFDEDTGEWVDEYALEVTGLGCGKRFRFGRSVSQARRSRGEHTAVDAVPPGVEVRWCVSRDGYEVRCGGIDAFGPPETQDGRTVRVADVHLVPNR